MASREGANQKLPLNGVEKPSKASRMPSSAPTMRRSIRSKASQATRRRNCPRRSHLDVRTARVSLRASLGESVGLSTIARFEPCSGPTWRDPFGMYRALRDHDPVHHVAEGDYWVLFSILRSTPSSAGW